MTDFTAQEAERGRPAPSRRSAEFIIYFTLLFIAGIPFGMVFWVLDVIRKRSLNTMGPLARAWTEADRITPLIFSA